MSERIKLQLSAMAHRGLALGRHEGRVVFVPYGVPGDTALVEIETSKKDWARARLIEVVKPSPDRVSPPCPYFGPHGCGGCQWQHIRYEAQLRYKTAVVCDQLARLAGLGEALVRPMQPVGEPWAYRNHVQLHPAVEGLGYISADDDQRVQPIAQCLIMHPLLAELYEQLDLEIEGLVQLSLRAGVRTGQRMVIFETEDEEPFGIEVDVPVSCVLLRHDGLPITLVGWDFLEEEVAGHRYKVSAGSFFQVNTAGAEALVHTVSAMLAPQVHQRLLDLYAGVGLFSVPLAPHVARVIAIEQSPMAVLDARENLQRAGVENAEVLQGDVAEMLHTLEGPIELAIADPPRAGCGTAVVTRLAELGVERLVLVACDPATMARDARTLGEHGYHLVEVQPLDLFPQTYHIESVALFVRG
ncbi:MAG: class I SAM-dependent RNA methyltransferase [Anaerolineae bacterium]|nr:class I SAM-dependent RNA methyltransferase [Anaerolineae bacterium]MDW8071586.1 class I SAM-dependent RNA methyltransferase [Anaerolineae bacterium]